MTEETQTVAAKDAPDTAVSRIYEVGYHIIPTVKEESIEGVVASIRSVIEKAGGSFIAEGAPSLMKLSYPMVAREGDRNIEYDRGFFGWIKFEAPIEAAQVLDHALKSDRNILRHIVFRTVREETRARLKTPTLREVRRTDTIKSTPRQVEDTSVPVSEADLDKAIETLTTD